MRSVLTALLLIVFTVAHAVPAPFSMTDGNASGDGTALIADAGTAAGMIKDSAADAVDFMLCCAGDFSEEAEQAASSCAADCTSVLPFPPGLRLLPAVHADADRAGAMRALAPPVADQPPQPV